MGTLERRINDRKGCGGVMRVAPFGLLPQRFPTEWVFDAAAEAAGYTHGHPTGKLASGTLAVIVHELCDGADLDDAISRATDVLVQHKGHEETSTALTLARHLAATAPAGPVTVERLGGGWIAEEALAIAVYAALAYPGPGQFLDALALAVTHSGDSDSTGAICGNLLGALHGETALPAELVFTVEGRSVILQLADDFALEFTQGKRLHGDYGPHTEWTKRYPGW
jgi:ADP-ribosylglycohydrolase